MSVIKSEKVHQPNRKPAGEEGRILTVTDLWGVPATAGACSNCRLEMTWATGESQRKRMENCHQYRLKRITWMCAPSQGIKPVEVAATGFKGAAAAAAMPANHRNSTLHRIIDSKPSFSTLGGSASKHRLFSSKSVRGERVQMWYNPPVWRASRVGGNNPKAPCTRKPLKQKHLDLAKKKREQKIHFWPR